jgi:UDP-N-acetylmuramoylalanine--D-glutamate ligase
VSRRALVVGLGRSGRAAALLLARRGWEVVAVDADAVSAPELDAAGVEVRAPWNAPVPDVELAVKSPGVPGDAVPVLGARTAGVPVWSEIELAARELPNPLAGITGTNGKTTTTELTAHLLRAGGLAAAACGNQGTPLAGLVDASDPAAWLVVECSSFQLEDVETFRPRAAALLNLAPDHLDRHGSLEGYRDAKLRLFAAQEAGDLAILPAGLDATGAAPARRTYDGPPGPDAAAWAEGGLHVAGLGRVVAWEEVALRGRHNRQNAMAAAALAAHAGLGADALAEGLASFRPVPHRLEPVGTAGGVAYVNDSKATNPDAAIAALDAYPRGVHLIAGGRAKGTPFAALAEAARGAVVRAYLVGEAGEEIGRALADAGVPAEAPGTVEAAVAAAAARAVAGETVLLSPGCASFDQFADYQERGEAFRAAARAAGAR